MSGDPVPHPTLAHRTVDRMARRFEGRGLTRRSLLVRLAVVGSVLTVAPLRWVLRPTSAYATVCGEGASCGAGWTAFCCTINRGANTCPPGSYVAGWWKIDASPFCQGEPRYIVDCNRTPTASCRCHCADEGTCDRRKVCCNRFRYGQCNTQVPGTTEVVCRVVICTVPWEWDPACGRTVLTDNRTRSHNAPCLPGEDATAIDLRYQDLGMTGSVLGAPVGPETGGPRSGTWRRFAHGLIVWRAATGALLLLGVAAQRYDELDGPAGPLGYPRTEARAFGDGLGERIRFEHGDIYIRGGEAFVVIGAAARRYDALGGPAGILGHLTSSTREVGDGRGTVTDFAHGAIYTTGNDGQELLGAMHTRFVDLGGPVDSGLGYPIGPADDRLQRFERGLLVVRDVTPFVLRGAIARRYWELGAIRGPWGVPLGDQERVGRADTVGFDTVTVFAGEGRRAWALEGPVLAHYLDDGGPAGVLGLPTSDSFRTRRGQLRGAFEGGAIEIDPATGETTVVRQRVARSPDDLTR